MPSFNQKFSCSASLPLRLNSGRPLPLPLPLTGRRWSRLFFAGPPWLTRRRCCIANHHLMAWHQRNASTPLPSPSPSPSPVSCSSIRSSLGLDISCLRLAQLSPLLPSHPFDTRLCQRVLRPSTPSPPAAGIVAYLTEHPSTAESTLSICHKRSSLS